MVDTGGAVDIATYVAQEDADFSWISPATHPGSRDRLVRLLRTYSPSSTEPYRVGDIGCGTGSFTATIAQTYDADVTGVDLSEPAVEQARVAVEDTGARILHDDAVNHLAAETYDFVYCINLLQALAQPEPLFTALHNGLAPEGYAAVTAPAAGAESVFVGPAPEDAVTAADDRITVRTQQAEIVISDTEWGAQIDADIDLPHATVTGRQHTIDPDWFRTTCVEYGLDVVAEDQLACDPSGLPTILDLFGYDAGAAEELVAAYHDDPETVEDYLPEVQLYVLEPASE